MLNSFLNFISIITSGRLGSDSNIYGRFQLILEESPFVGFGFGNIPYADFGFLEIAHISGYLGLFLYFLIFIFLISLGLIKAINSSKEGIFLFFIWLMLLGASFGAPAITANRTSVVIWILTTLLLLNLSNKNYVLSSINKK